MTEQTVKDYGSILLKGTDPKHLDFVSGHKDHDVLERRFHPYYYTKRSKKKTERI